MPACPTCAGNAHRHGRRWRSCCWPPRWQHAAVRRPTPPARRHLRTRRRPRPHLLQASQPVTSPATPGSDGTALVNFDDATDPGAAAQRELVLNQEARADGGMAALIGDNGEAVFEELDARASAFSQESLEQIAHLVDTGEMPEGATSAAPARLVAMVGSGLPSRQNEPAR